MLFIKTEDFDIIHGIEIRKSEESKKRKKRAKENKIKRPTFRYLGATVYHRVEWRRLWLFVVTSLRRSQSTPPLPLCCKKWRSRRREAKWRGACLHSNLARWRHNHSQSDTCSNKWNGKKAVRHASLLACFASQNLQRPLFFSFRFLSHLRTIFLFNRGFVASTRIDTPLCRLFGNAAPLF